MLYAVTIEPLRAIYFLDTKPEENRWKVQEGVELDIPFNYDTWPDGEESPEQILCTSVENPLHYKLFKYRRDINPAEFQPTGKNFGGIYSRSTWARLTRSLAASTAVEDVPDTEPPGATDEAIALINRRG